jgi:hypothetical protein
MRINFFRPVYVKYFLEQDYNCRNKYQRDVIWGRFSHVTDRIDQVQFWVFGGQVANISLHITSNLNENNWTLICLLSEN